MFGCSSGLSSLWVFSSLFTISLLVAEVLVGCGGVFLVGLVSGFLFVHAGLLDKSGDRCYRERCFSGKIGLGL